MSFQSLHRILGSLEEQTKWREQPFQCLLKLWPEVVGVAVAAHTQPLTIRRDVLRVATPSAVWAQELTFGRQHILEKLNLRLASPLVDIQFSSAEWQPSRNSSSTADKPQLSWQEHPSYCVDASEIPKADKTLNSQNPSAAFQRWAKVMRSRLDGLPLCPKCRCPTPPGELQRWSICSICAARQW